MIIVVLSYSELSQATAFSLTISTKAPLQMLNHAQKTPLVIHNTSFFTIYRFYNNITFLWIIGRTV